MVASTSRGPSASERLLAGVLLAPALILLAWYYVWPTTRTFWLSFQRLDTPEPLLPDGVTPLTGENYRRLIQAAVSAFVPVFNGPVEMIDLSIGAAATPTWHDQFDARVLPVGLAMPLWLVVALAVAAIVALARYVERLALVTGSDADPDLDPDRAETPRVRTRLPYR